MEEIQRVDTLQGKAALVAELRKLRLFCRLLSPSFLLNELFYIHIFFVNIRVIQHEHISL